MRLNKYEARAIRAAKMEQVLQGRGLYIYENNSDGDLILPRPTASGMRNIPARGQFQGDNYYMGMVKSNQLRLIKQLRSPEQEKAMEVQKLNEAAEANRLLLDQPETFTNDGQIEYVAPQAKLPPLNEQMPGFEGQDVLLNEEPIDGLEIDLD